MSIFLHDFMKGFLDTHVLEVVFELQEIGTEPTLRMTMKNS